MSWTFRHICPVSLSTNTASAESQPEISYLAVFSYEITYRRRTAIVVDKHRYLLFQEALYSLYRSLSQSEMMSPPYKMLVSYAQWHTLSARPTSVCVQLSDSLRTRSPCGTKAHMREKSIRDSTRTGQKSIREAESRGSGTAHYICQSATAAPSRSNVCRGRHDGITEQVYGKRLVATVESGR